MSNSQPNAWQTASRNTNRPSNSNSASSSRTPQNRSTNASPAQQNPSQPPKQPSTGGNVWTQRAAAAAQQQQHQPTSSSSNGPAGLQEDTHTPSNGFNAAEVKGVLAREPAPAVYKVQEAQGGQRNSGGAWGSKANHMANGQPFFLQLAKQVAAFEGGG